MKYIGFCAVICLLIVNSIVLFSLYSDFEELEEKVESIRVWQNIDGDGLRNVINTDHETLFERLKNIDANTTTIINKVDALRVGH